MERVLPSCARGILLVGTATIKCAGRRGSLRLVRSRVLSGDARALRELGLQPDSVDCIVTSPPYWNLKQYDDDLEGEIGHGQTLDLYLDDMRRVLEECIALAKSTGVMWVVIDTLRYPARHGREFEILPLPTLLADLAQEVGWRFHDVLVWRKNKTLPYSGSGKLRNLVEYILLLTKTREFKHRPYRLAERHQPKAEWLAGWPERYHPLGRNPSNIWEIPIPTQGIWAQSERLHFCPLPADLVRRCIDLTSDPGDVIFDPFAGIGTVPAQAEAMGRTGIGVELNRKFIEVFEARTRQQLLAGWEEGARDRKLKREDQAAEAALILRLRALKAGKDLMTELERLAQGRPADHPASRVLSVIVRPDAEPETGIDIIGGTCAPLPVTLLVINEASDEQQADLSAILGAALESTSFRTFGLDLSFALLDPTVADEELFLTSPDTSHGTPLYEFGLSRHGAFTERPMTGLFPTLPRLLTTIDLGPPVHPSTLSPLDQARLEGEKKLLQSLFTSGLPLDKMAQQLRLPRLELEHLLQRHGLVPAARAFAVALPSDLLDRAEQVTFDDVASSLTP
jgi:DNA modification methylase